MPLGRRLSKIFKQKQDGFSPTTPGCQSTPAILPTIEEDDQQAIIAATAASLRDENTRLEAQVQEQTNQISRHKRAASLDAQEISSLNDVVADRSADNASLRRTILDLQQNLNSLQLTQCAEISNLNHRAHSLSIQLRRSQEEESRFERENQALQNDLQALHTSNQQYQSWIEKAKAKFKEHQSRFRDFEQRLAAALDPMDQSSQSAYMARLTQIRTNEDLEATFNVEKTAMTQQINTLQESVRLREEQNCALQVQISAMQTDLEEEKSKNEGILRAVNVDRESMIGELEQLRSCQSALQSLFSNGLTPRIILALLMFKATFPKLPGNQTPESWRFLQTYRADDLSYGLFDVPLVEQEHLAAFVSSVIPGSSGAACLQNLTLLPCPGCKTVKFTVKSPTATNRNFDEFSRHFMVTACCSSPICTDCLVKALKTSLSSDWWYDIGSQSWLRCPIEGCGRQIGIRRIDRITDILRESGEQDVHKYTSM